LYAMLKEKEKIKTNKQLNFNFIANFAKYVMIVYFLNITIK